MSLAFGVSHLPGGHKPSRPASLGYRMLLVVAGISQILSIEARNTHHVRLRNPRSNAELYQNFPAYAATSNFPRACTGTILIGYGKHVVDSTGPGCDKRAHLQCASPVYGS